MKNKPLLKYITGLLLFGSNGFVNSFISLTSYETVLTRSVLGSIFLITLYTFSNNKQDIFKYKKDMLFIALSGIAMAADWLFLFEAYAQIGVGLSILINYFGPVVVIALSPLILKEKLMFHKVFALILAFIGILFVSGTAAVNGINIWGLLCAVLSAFSYAAMVLTNKRSQKIIGMNNSMIQLLCTAIAVVIFVGIKQGLYIPVKSSEIIPILWLGIINTGLGCYLYFSSIGNISAQSVGILGYIEPLSGIILASVFLKEKMTLLQIVGAVCIISGAMIGELWKENVKQK